MSQENSPGEIFIGILVWIGIIYGLYSAWGYFFKSDEDIILSYSYKQLMLTRASDLAYDESDMEKIEDLVNKEIDRIEDKVGIDFSKSIGDAIDDHNNISNVEIKLERDLNEYKLYTLSYINTNTNKKVIIPILLTEESYPFDIVLTEQNTKSLIDFLYLYDLSEGDIRGALGRLEKYNAGRYMPRN